MKHVFFMNHQEKVLREKRSNLLVMEVFMWFDFAMNWLTKLAREIQSAHFGGGSRQQISLHTGVGYTKSETESFCTVSENRDHGPPEIMAHIVPVIRKMLNKVLVDDYILHFQSDSPTMQYRGKDMFAYLAQVINFKFLILYSENLPVEIFRGIDGLILMSLMQVLPKLFPKAKQITWNYTEAGHGKGPVDGVGSFMKRFMDDLVAHGHDIDTFDKFEEHMKKIKNITTSVVTNKDIDEMKKYEISPKTFNGTNTVHQVTWNRESPNTLFFNYLSCFDCVGKCRHFFMGTLQYPLLEELGEPNELDVDDPQLSPPPQTEDVHEQPSNETEAEPAENLKKNDWVAVPLSGRLYPG
jgi:hypothetical protein